jgi:hypothetical protein
MNGTVAQSAQFRLDAPTTVAALLTVTFLLAGGWGCTLIPTLAGYNPGEMLQKLLPIASAGLFPIFRRGLAFRQRGPQAAPADDAPGYLFVKYTIVGALLLIGLFEVVSGLVGLMAAVVDELTSSTIARDIGDEIKVAVMQSGGTFVVAPLLAVVSAIFGWRIHRRKVRYSVLCVFLIAIIVLLLRVLDVAWLSFQSDRTLQKAFEETSKLALYLAPPGIVLVGMFLGLTSSAVGRGVMRLFGRNPQVA